MSKDIQDIGSVFQRLSQENTHSDNSQSKSPILNALSVVSSFFKTDMPQDFGAISSQLGDLGNLGDIVSGIDIDGIVDDIDVDGIIDDLDIDGIVDSADTSGSGSGESSGESSGSTSSTTSDGSSGDSSSEGSESSTSSTSSPTDISNEAQTLFNSLTSGINSQYTGLISDLENKLTDESDRRDAVDALRTFHRNNLPSLALARAIAQSSTINAENKTNYLGEIAALCVKSECLLGWLHLGGINQSSVPTWERSSPDNLDEFFISHAGFTGADSDWSAKFSGYGHKQSGLSNSIVTSQAFANSYQHYQWASAQTSGVTWLDLRDWQVLSSELLTSQNTSTTVDNWFNQKNITPKAGDLIILGQSSHRWKSNNQGTTAIVEKYDSTTKSLHLILGNFDRNRAGGEKLNLTDRNTVKTILGLVRFTASQYQSDNNESYLFSNSQAQSLISGLKQYQSSLLNVALNQNWFKTTDSNSTMAELYQG